MTPSITTQLYERIKNDYVAPALAPSGFKPYAHGCFRATRGDIVWQVVANFTKEHGRDFGHFGLSVGVGSKSILKFLRQCPAFKDRGGHGLFGRELWGLTRRPEFSGGWPIDPTTDAAAIGNKSVAAIDQYVLPFFKEYGSYEGILRVMRTDPNDDPFIGWERIYPLTAAHWLKGERGEAMRIFEAELERLENQWERTGDPSDESDLLDARNFMLFLKSQS